MAEARLKLSCNDLFCGQKEGIGYLTVGVNRYRLKGSFKVHQVWNLGNSHFASENSVGVDKEQLLKMVDGRALIGTFFGRESDRQAN